MLMNFPYPRYRSRWQNFPSHKPRRSRCPYWLKPTHSKCSEAIYKGRTLCSNPSLHTATRAEVFIHGPATQRCGGYFSPCAHISQRRLLLHRTVSTKRSIRLLVENGPGRQSRKIGYRRSRERKDHSRSRAELLPQGTRPVSTISQSSLYETRLEIVEGGKGLLFRLLQGPGKELSDRTYP